MVLRPPKSKPQWAPANGAWIDYLLPGECKHLISDYLKCLKLRKGVNDEQCRKLAKGYLGCRMDRLVRHGRSIFILAVVLMVYWLCVEQKPNGSWWIQESWFRISGREAESRRAANGRYNDDGGNDFEWKFKDKCLIHRSDSGCTIYLRDTSISDLFFLGFWPSVLYIHHVMAL